MTIAIRGTTPATATSVTNTVSVTLNGTRQPQSGDRLLIYHSNDFYASSAMPTPTVGGSSTGVAAVTNGSVDPGTDFIHIKSYYYDVGSTGDLTVAVTETGAGDEEKQLTIYVLSGVNAAVAPTAAGSNSTTGQATWVVTGITATDTDEMLFILAQSNGHPGAPPQFTPPGAPWVEDIDSDISSAASYTAGHEQLSASGSTGTRTFTPGSSIAWSAVAVSVRAGSAAPPAELGGPWLTSPLQETPFGEKQAPWQVRPFQPPIPLTVWANTPLGDQSVSLDDTAAADDALTVAVAAPLAETASAADSLAAAAATLLADTAAAADSLTITAAVPLSETGGASDALTVSAAVPMSDTASAADAATVSAAIPLDDTASADDQLLATFDQVGGTWIISPFADMPFTASVAMPIWTNAAVVGDQIISLDDTASASDALDVSAAVPLSDTAAAADALTAGVPITLSESAAGADALAVTAAAPLADTASAADSLSVSAAVPLADTAVAADALTAGVPITLADTATATDSLSITVTLTLADVAAASDVLAVSTAVPMSDTAVAADALSRTITVSFAELAAAADAVSVAAAIPLADTGSGLDALSLVKQGVGTNVIARVATGSRRYGATTGSGRYSVTTGET